MVCSDPMETQQHNLHDCNTPVAAGRGDGGAKETPEIQSGDH
jgi:hypothetical protein